MRPRFYQLLLILGCVAWLPRAVVHACNVPVFRYALERWKPDPYEAILFHDGPFSPELTDVTQRLRQSDEKGQSLANLRLTTVDLQGPLDDATRALWQAQAGATAPWLVVRFPSALMVERIMWSGPATHESVELLLDSPVRREIAKQLLAGCSTVWLILESGDDTRDRQVTESLDAALKELASKIKLPDETAHPGGVLKLPQDQGEGTLSSVPLQIAFSITRVSRTDPAERALVANILETDEALSKETGIVVLPVFGRGRALQAFPGLDLEATMLSGVEEFLCGECSCSVKAQNPGMDLLIAANWEAMLEGPTESPEPVSEPTAPTLVTIPPGHSTNQSHAADGLMAAERPTTPTTNEYLFRLLVVVAAAVGLAVSLLVGRSLRHRKPKPDDAHG